MCSSESGEVVKENVSVQKSLSPLALANHPRGTFHPSEDPTRCLGNHQGSPVDAKKKNLVQGLETRIMKNLVKEIEGPPQKPKTKDFTALCWRESQMKNFSVIINH